MSPDFSHCFLKRFSAFSNDSSGSTITVVTYFPPPGAASGLPSSAVHVYTTLHKVHAIRRALRCAPHPNPLPRRKRGQGEGPAYLNSGARTSATTDISLIRMFMEGPEVSLNGSPTVSPTTAALWASDPLPPRLPSSIYFLALSQAPPLLAMNSARKTPMRVAP